MNEDVVDGHQVLSDGRTVWVNDATGYAVARFSSKGIDIHQAAGCDGGECLFCTHEETSDADWVLFRQKMVELKNIYVPERHKPKWLTR